MKDDGGISGIDPSSVENMQKDFASALINPTKLSPAAYVAIERVEIEGKIVLSIHVRPVGKYIVAMEGFSTEIKMGFRYHRPHSAGRSVVSSQGIDLF